MTYQLAHTAEETGALTFLEYSTPRSIKWTASPKKARVFASKEEALQSADLKRARGVYGEGMQVVQAGGVQ